MAPTIGAVAKLPAVDTATPMQAAEVGGALVVAPQNFGEVMAFADRMSESRFVPAHLRGRPADCMAVCMQALRWGMDPFMVAQKTYFTKEGSPPGYEAQLVNAVVYARAPLKGRLDIQWEGKWPARVCIVTGIIRGDDRPKVRSVNAANIKTRNSPMWLADPDQQLAYYTTRAWARLYCPDVLMGVYTREEIIDGEFQDVTGHEPATPAPAPTASRLDALEQVIDNAAATAAAEEATDAPAPDDGARLAAETWANECMGWLATQATIAKIDAALAKWQPKLAELNQAHPDIALALVSAADERKQKIERGEA